MNLSHKAVPASWIFLGLFALFFCGVGILYAMSGIEDDELTTARQNLIALGDWVVKASVGAILGFAGGAGLASRNGVERRP